MERAEPGTRGSTASVDGRVLHQPSAPPMAANLALRDSARPLLPRLEGPQSGPGDPGGAWSPPRFTGASSRWTSRTPRRAPIRSRKSCGGPSIEASPHHGFARARGL